MYFQANQVRYRKRIKLQRLLLHPATGEHKPLVRIRYGATSSPDKKILWVNKRIDHFYELQKQ